MDKQNDDSITMNLSVVFVEDHQKENQDLEDRRGQEAGSMSMAFNV